MNAEQQQDGAVEAPDLTYRVTQAYRAARFMRLDDDALIQGVVTAALAERAALAARVAELESERTSLAVLLLAEPDEREADTRTVVEACAGVMDGTAPQPIRHEYAVQRLRARFADRIAALDADTDGGAK